MFELNIISTCLNLTSIPLLTCQNMGSMVDGMLDLQPVIDLFVSLKCASNVFLWSTPKIIVGSGILLLKDAQPLRFDPTCFLGF